MSLDKNTKKAGALHFMIYPAGKGRFTAICFELGLIREGDNPLKLRSRITSLARKYVESIRKNNLSDDLLNQTVPKKYLIKYKEHTKAMKEYENLQKWQKAFEVLIWKLNQKAGKLLISK